MKLNLSNKANRLAYWLIKDVDKAIHQYNMIEDGDTIAVAISGGKDSLSLLHMLDFRRKYVPERYTLYPIHILGDARGTACPANPDLLTWLADSGFEYTVERVDLPENETLPMTCHRCTRNRRRTLFKVAQDLGCSKIALGHHADDLAETALLNLIFSGRVETMAPEASYFNGLFHLVRPLCYIPEKEIRRFAKACEFPPPPPACPNSGNSKRSKVAELIRQVEPWGKDFRVNLLRTGLKGIAEQDDSNDGYAGKKAV